MCLRPSLVEHYYPQNMLDQSSGDGLKLKDVVVRDGVKEIIFRRKEIF